MSMQTLGEIKTDQEIWNLSYRFVLEMLGNKLHPVNDEDFEEFVLEHLSRMKIEEIKIKFKLTLFKVYNYFMSMKNYTVEDLPDYEELATMFAKPFGIDYERMAKGLPPTDCIHSFFNDDRFQREAFKTILSEVAQELEPSFDRKTEECYLKLISLAKEEKLLKAFKETTELLAEYLKEIGWVPIKEMPDNTSFFEKHGNIYDKEFKAVEKRLKEVTNGKSSK